MADADSTTERWAPIPGYEGYYDVSDMGRVKSLARVVVRNNGWLLPVRERILAGGISDGYHTVILARNGAKRNTATHRAVMLAFVGPRPDGMCIRHLNGNSTDNRLSNLTYGTPAENSQDSIKHGTQYFYNIETVKTHCPEGHELADPNLVVSNLPRRKCKACDRSRRRVKYNPARDFRQDADEQYRRIMAGERGKTHCPEGHELAEPNLVASALPLRKCKACVRSRGRVKRNPSRDFHQDVKEQYARIMAGERSRLPLARRVAEAA